MTAAPVELGVKFRADFDGAVTGIRFYKAAANTGTHIGSLWTASGTRLAQATFSERERHRGWQTVTFDSPVAITPGTTYVASYFAPNGHYSVTASGFAPRSTTRRCRRSANGDERQRRLRVRRVEHVPDRHFNAANYWVDVLFAPAPAAGHATDVTATAGPGVGERLLDRAGERRAVDLLQGHALHRRDGADAEDASPAPRRRPARRSPG